MLESFSGALHCDADVALSYSSSTSQRLNRFVWIIVYPAVLFKTFFVDQEPSSQDRHGRSRTTKPFFAWQVEQEFCLCPLQTSWVLLVRWPWRRYPRQEGSQSRLTKQQRSIVLGYPEHPGNSHAGVSPSFFWHTVLVLSRSHSERLRKSVYLLLTFASSLRATGHLHLTHYFRRFVSIGL